MVVFFDSDCVYEAGWLRGLIEGLGDRPDIDVLGGETMIRTDSAWALASAVLFSFEFYSGRGAVYDAERFHFNNVAFRRAVLDEAPPPVRLPVFRTPTTFYAALLRQRGFRIGRQPKSRARHQPLQAAHHGGKAGGIQVARAAHAGLVLQGREKPEQCPAFGSRCPPEHPLGAPMVSSEGACAAYYLYRRGRAPPVAAGAAPAQARSGT